jgi:hypothetical protein
MLGTLIPALVVLLAGTLSLRIVIGFLARPANPPKIDKAATAQTWLRAAGRAAFNVWQRRQAARNEIKQGQAVPRSEKRVASSK